MDPKYIKVYSTKTCPYCMMEKTWLENNKVKHEIVYVDSNRQEAMNMVSKTGQMGVPVTEVGYDNGKEEYIVGFDVRRLSDILKIKA